MPLQNKVHYTFYSVQMPNKYFGSKRSVPQNESIEKFMAPKKKKRISVTNFDKAELPKHIDSWKKNPPAGD